MNAYVLDPSHIAPSRSDANSNGHFPVPNNHVPAGTPRGFNLQNLFSFGQNGQNGMGFQSGGQPFMGAMGGAGYMGNGAMQPGMDMAGMHNPGVMRKGGNRFNQRTGPYDRRGGGAGRSGYMGGGGGGFSAGPMAGPGGMIRMPSGSAGMGFVAQGGGGGGGKWGDGAGGSMPREAVQGRSIKSYEDLDAQPNQSAGTGAAGGSGAAELDY